MGLHLNFLRTYKFSFVPILGKKEDAAANAGNWRRLFPGLPLLP